MTRIIDNLNRARDDPENDYHLAISLRNLLSQARSGSIKSPDIVEERLGDRNATPLFEAVYSHAYWELVDEDAYTEGAQPALQSYQEAFEAAIENEWSGVAVFCLSELITLYGELNHQEELRQWLETAVSVLETEYGGQDVHLGNVGRLVDTIQEHRHIAPKPVLQRVIDYLQERVEYARRRDEYQNERGFLEDLIGLKVYLGEDASAEKAALADSFEAEAEEKGQRSRMVRASVLSTAIERCESFVDDRRVAEWKREVRAANRAAFQDEMTEVTHEPDEEDIEELEEAIESLVETYEGWSDQFDPSSAFKLLLTQKPFLPDLEASREIAEGSIISEVITRTTISPEGDTVAIRDPQDELDQRPANYSAMAQFSDKLLSSLLYRLISRGILAEHHFYRLIWDAHWLSIDDQAFLTDLVIAFFSHRYAEALHIGVARLEGVISRTLEHHDVPVTKFESRESEQRTLGGLLRQMRGTVDENVISYLNYRYVDPAGTNIRNRVSHGQLHYGVAGSHHTVLCLFDIFRIISEIETAYE